MFPFQAFIAFGNYCISDIFWLMGISMLSIYAVYLVGLPLYGILNALTSKSSSECDYFPLLLILAPFFVPFVISFGWNLITPCGL